MHVPCYPVAILAGVDQENHAAHAGETAHGAQSCRAAADDDCVVVGGRSGIGGRQRSAMNGGRKRREKQGGERTHRDGNHKLGGGL
jgi:hypothetical protein